MSKIYYLKVSELRLLNKNLKFDSTLQRKLFNSLENKNFILKDESVEKLSNLLPTGVSVEPLIVSDIDGEEFISDYLEKTQRLNKLQNEINEILK